MKKNVITVGIDNFALFGLNKLLIECGYIILESLPNIKLIDINKFETAVDLLILDYINFNSLEKDIINALQRKNMKMKTIILSCMGFFQILQVANMNISGLLSKGLSVEEIKIAISFLEMGHNFRIYDDIKYDDWHNRLTEVGLLNTLSGREMQVFIEIIHGKINRDIASDMGISDKTVSTYKRLIMDKLHIKRLPELLEFARRNNI